MSMIFSVWHEPEKPLGCCENLIFKGKIVTGDPLGLVDQDGELIDDLALK